MAVKNSKGDPLTVSVSSATTFLDCKRKWYYSYFLRLRAAPTAALIFGNAVHDGLEEKLKTGKWPAKWEELSEDEPHPPAFRAARAALDRAMTGEDPLVIGPDGVAGGWHTEDWIEADCGPLRFVGKVDLHRPPEGGRLKVFDWKTAKDPSARYNPNTPAKLAKKEQPLIYAHVLATMHNVQGAAVDVRYIFVGRLDPEVTLDVNTEIEWPDIEAKWAEFVGYAEEMATIATTAKGPDDVEANTSSCRKFGRCDHWDICPASPANRVAAMYTNPNPVKHDVNKDALMPTTSDTLAALAAIANKVAPITKPTPAPAPPEAPPAATHTSLDNVVAQLARMSAMPVYSMGLPADILASVVTGTGHSPEAAAAAAGMALDGDKYVTVAEPEEVPAAEEATDAAPEEEPAPVSEADLEAAAAVEVVDQLRELEKVAALRKSRKESDRAAVWLIDNVLVATPVSDVIHGGLKRVLGRQRMGAGFVAKACDASPFHTFNPDTQVVEVTGTVWPDDSPMPVSPEPAPAPEPEPTPEPELRPAPVATLLDEVAAQPAEVRVHEPKPGKKLVIRDPAPPTPSVRYVLVDAAVENWGQLPVLGVPGAVNLSTWLAPLNDEVCAHAKKVGMKGAEANHWGCIEFNKGFGLMSVAIREKLDTLPPLLVVDSKLPLASTFLAQLLANTPAGVLVIRGNK